MDYSKLGSLPAEIAVLVIFAAVSIALIKALSPLANLITNQHDVRLSTLETGVHDIREGLDDLRRTLDNHLQDDKSNFEEVKNKVDEVLTAIRK